MLEYTVKENLHQNLARIWTTPHYTVIAGFPSILKLEENTEISGWSFYCALYKGIICLKMQKRSRYIWL